MELEAVGEVEDVESIDKEPVTIPIVTYDDKKKKSVTKINFVCDVAPGVARDMVRATNQLTGRISALDALDYCEACVHETSRSQWEELIRGTEITTETVLALYTKLGEHYANRPFTKQSGSPAGPSSTKRTTPRAAKSRASKDQVSV